MPETYTGARIADAIQVEEGRFLEVGSSIEISALSQADTNINDLRGHLSGGQRGRGQWFSANDQARVVMHDS